MGQGQSSAEDSVNDNGERKTDYYELLGVDRQATDEEIRKAYRRKALELHPDRNYGNVEHATRLFAEIQTAHEVLSDQQERAWYDSHRDILLRGDQGTSAGAQEYSYNIRMTTADEVLRLTLKFNGRLDYSDSPTGFYGGLQDFFKKLAKEEDIACQWEDQEPIEYPDFGNKDDSYEDVVRPFFSAWNGFATRKSYSWKDEYRLSDAPDRRIRRLMEKENKKIREDAVREYNDAVRSLIAFVRKRDPRFQENQKTEAERQKILRDAAAAQAARARADRQAKLQELDQMSIPEWAQSRTKDEHEGGFSSQSDEEEHQYECVVCDKVFKSEAQYHTHEKSKKHQKLVKQLKRDMKQEDAEVVANPAAHNAVTPNGVETEPVEDADKDLQPATSNPPEYPPGQSPSGKEPSNLVPKGHYIQPDDVSSAELSDDDYAPRSEVENRLADDVTPDLSSKLEAATLENTPATSDTESSARPKLGKAKQKRAKKAAQQGSGSKTQSTPDSEFTCAACQSAFPSKTKLFTHIKEKGHAAPVAHMKGGGTKGGKGKKG